MSRAAAEAFVARLKNDDAFRERVLAAGDPAARTDLARAEGFDCTAEEIADYAGALADTEVSGVVGGFNGAGPLMHEMPDGGSWAYGGSVCGTS